MPIQLEPPAMPTYAVSLHFDRTSTEMLSALMARLANATGNRYMLDAAVPITVKASVPIAGTRQSLPFVAIYMQ